MNEDKIQALLDKEDCRELVRNYARALDRCDPEMMKHSFHPDGIFEHCDHYNGNAHEYCDFACDLLKTLPPQIHIAGQHTVELDGDRANGECYGLAIHRLITPAGESLDMILGARMLDHYERRDGVWKIAHRKTVLELNLDVPTNETMGAGALGDTSLDERFRGRKDRTDPFYDWFKIA